MMICEKVNDAIFNTEFLTKKKFNFNLYRKETTTPI